jgi:hypothetical protein
MPSEEVRRTEYEITQADLRNLLRGEGGVDLERILEDDKQVAMRIVGVRPGTIAARLGAQDGDTIESINDLRILTVAAAYRAADLAVKHGRIEIRGSRSGDPYITVLTLVA